jgi:hypothetical protein
MGPEKGCTVCREGRENFFKNVAGRERPSEGERRGKRPGMEAICSSETSVASQQTTWRHIPEDDTLRVKHDLVVLLELNKPETWFLSQLLRASSLCSDP